MSLLPDTRSSGKPRVRLLASASIVAASLAVLAWAGPPGAGVGGSAIADTRTGGIAVPGEPQVDDAVCLTRCVSTRKATPGSKIRISGSYLDRVSRVVFPVEDGTTRVKFVRRGYGAVIAIVPKRAKAGRLWVVTADGERSNKTPRELEVLPPEMIPEEVFPVRGRFSYGGAGSRFGAPRGGRLHQGQDLGAACGTPLVSVRRARVLNNSYDGGAGFYVVLKNLGTNSRFVYMHLIRKSGVKTGQVVGAGRKVGNVGNTGNSFGCHLHFEFWKGPWQSSGGRPIDPLPYLMGLRKR